METIILSNSALETEKSFSFTSGFTYEHQDKSRLHVNLYYQLFDNEINLLTADEIMLREGKYTTDEQIIRDENGVLNRIFQQYDNFSGTKTLGIDIEHEYQWHKLSIGSIKWQTNISASLFHKVEVYPGEGFNDVSGKFGKNQGMLYSALSWKNNDWKAKLSLTFQPSTKEFDVKLSSFLVTNIYLQNALSEQSKLTLGVMNLFNSTPPHNNALGWPYYFVDTLFVQGRTLYLNYSLTL